MNNDRYVARLPALQSWIDATLAASVELRRPVWSFGFQRLPLYFSEAILTAAGVVLVDLVPAPPLSALGLAEFKSFEMQHMAGITFRDTYFLQTSHARTESLHFHELVHIVQWKVLGPESFLLLYAEGLAKRGYAGSPLEEMAYRHQERFDRGQPAYAAEAEVREETLALAKFGVDSGRTG